MKKVLGSIIFGFFAIATLYAQQEAQFTNYMYNTMNINPAYAGSRGNLSVFGLHRTQWVGVDGAPTTNTFAIHSPLRDSKIGLGLNFSSDAIGPSSETTISSDFSYTINTSETFKLAFGLRATAHLLNVDFSKLNIYNKGDILAKYNIDNRFSPNFGAGAYWYSEDTFLGISIPNILEVQHFNRNQIAAGSSSVSKERMHFHIIGGKVFDIHPSIQFKPAFLAKIVEGAPLQMDVSANFLFHEKFTLGAAYRWDAAMSALAGFQVNENWFIGYGYDTDVTNLSHYNAGSHELFLRYEFNKKSNKIVNPRFF
jgi:type IX secretion system PorP/SprF family membrane protein